MKQIQEDIAPKSMTFEEFEKEIKNIFGYRNGFVVQINSEYEYKEIIIFRKDWYEIYSGVAPKYEIVRAFNDDIQKVFEEILKKLKKRKKWQVRKIKKWRMTRPKLKKEIWE